jgi:hypothetical protein
MGAASKRGSQVQASGGRYSRSRMLADGLADGLGGAQPIFRAVRFGARVLCTFRARDSVSLCGARESDPLHTTADPAATGRNPRQRFWPDFAVFGASPICHRLPLVATAWLHKRSIPSPEAGMRPGLGDRALTCQRDDPSHVERGPISGAPPAEVGRLLVC